MIMILMIIMTKTHHGIVMQTLWRYSLITIVTVVAVAVAVAVAAAAVAVAVAVAAILGTTVIQQRTIV